MLTNSFDTSVEQDNECLFLVLFSRDPVRRCRADVPAPEQPELFLKKLQQCCTVFDFMDTLSDLKMKEYKRSTLNELVDYVTVSRGYLTEQAYPEVVKMVSGRGLTGLHLKVPRRSRTPTPVVTRAVCRMLMSFLVSVSTLRCPTTYSGPFRPATATSLTPRRTNPRSRPPGHTYRCARWNCAVFDRCRGRSL